MSRLPFTIYDFFGYLAAGFLLVAAGDYAFDQGWLLRDNLGLIGSIFWTVSAYITGHIVANLAGFSLQGQFVCRVLRPPEVLLFDAHRSRGWRRLFPGYHVPLPRETRERVLAKAAERASISTPGRGLFYHCHPIVLRHQVTRERLDSFLNLYGFARNACMALGLAWAVLLGGVTSDRWRDAGVGEHVWWAIALAPIAAVGMFYRYLKFFREYTVEVFRTYAEVE